MSSGAWAFLASYMNGGTHPVRNEVFRANPPLDPQRMLTAFTFRTLIG